MERGGGGPKRLLKELTKARKPVLRISKFDNTVEGEHYRARQLCTFSFQLFIYSGKSRMCLHVNSAQSESEAKLFEHCNVNSLQVYENLP